MYIYKSTNNLTGKIYIGLSTMSVEESTNYYGSGKLITRALKKYGKENFTKEILIRDIEDRSKLALLEIDLIKEYKSTDRNIGYNISPGGDLNPDAQRVAIYKYNTDGELVNLYSSIQHAIEDGGEKNIYRKAQRDIRPIKGYWYSKLPLTSAEVIEKHSNYIKNRTDKFKRAAAIRFSDPDLAQFYRDNMRKVRLNK